MLRPTISARTFVRIANHHQHHEALRDFESLPPRRRGDPAHLQVHTHYTSTTSMILMVWGSKWRGVDSNRCRGDQKSFFGFSRSVAEMPFRTTLRIFLKFFSLLYCRYLQFLHAKLFCRFACIGFIY